MIKKVTALIICFCTVLSFCACDNNEKNEPENNTTEEYVLPTEIVDADISLPYTSAEGFDPYTAKSTLNRDLIPVLYESLYLPTNDGKGRAVLAISGEVEGKKATVKIIKGVKFSNGAELVGADIKASFEKAKNNNYYKGTLSNVESVKVIDNYTVVFSFNRESLFTLNTLCFPIVKISGKNILGSGKYKLQYLEKTPYLSVNTNHRGFSPQWNKQIALYDMAGKNGPIYPFKANEISLYKNNLSGEKYVNLSSQTISEDTNNLVYIGVNSNWAGSLCSVDWVRHAVNIGINRTIIGASSFLGQTSAVVTPYKTEFYALNSEDLPTLEGELQRAVSILERNGYDKVNSEGIRTNGSNTLRVSILVCTENEYKKGVAQAVKNSLVDMGFGVTIKEKKNTEEFKASLDEGHFDLYIGETALSYDYGLEEFFSNSGALNYGISEAFFAEYNRLIKGEYTLMNFIEAFETGVPFIPLFYKKSIVSINPNVSGADKNNIYSSINDWKTEN